VFPLCAYDRQDRRTDTVRDRTVGYDSRARALANPVREGHRALCDRAFRTLCEPIFALRGARCGTYPRARSLHEADQSQRSAPIRVIPCIRDIGAVLEAANLSNPSGGAGECIKSSTWWGSSLSFYWS
jgi:hypothetical protein